MVNLTKGNSVGGDDVDFTMASFDPATANIDAMLAVTFARNAKMMKFINKIYDADKDYYASAAKRNSRFKSRIIPGNRVTIKLHAIKALAIITVAKDDEKLRERLHAQVEKTYKQEAQFFAKYGPDDIVHVKTFVMSGRKRMVHGDTSDALTYEVISLYFYFCRHNGIPMSTRDVKGEMKM